MSTMQDSGKGRPERAVYATVMSLFAAVGLAALIAAFFIYALQLLPTFRPPQETVALWHLSADQLAAMTAREARLSGRLGLASGDLVAIAPVIFLALATIFAFLSVSVVFIRRKNGWYAFFAIVQAAILILAAAGVFP